MAGTPPKYPEKVAELKERRARQVEEGAAAIADYYRSQQAARDQLRRLRQERLAREKLKCTGT